MRGRCSPESQRACPLMKCLGTDLHHLEYPARDYKDKIASTHRDQPWNKVQLQRCAHQAIHASGYVPERPPRPVMVEEIWEKGSQRAIEELNRQLTIGRQVLEGFEPLPPEAA